MEGVLWNSLLANGGVVIKQEYCVNDTSGEAVTPLQENMVKEEAELVIEDTLQSEQDIHEEVGLNHSGLKNHYVPSASHQNLEVNDPVHSTFLDLNETHHSEQSDRKLFTHLLMSWKIKSEQIKHLLDLGFMVNDLKIITNEDIKELFTKDDIVTRIRFRDGITRLKESGIEYFGIINTLETQDDSVAVDENCSLKSSNMEVSVPAEQKMLASDQNSVRLCADFHESDGIDQLLLKTVRGKQVLKHYKKYKQLTVQHHKIITDIVVDGLINRRLNRRLTCNDFILCTEKIVTTFPNVRRDIFFIKASKGNHRGKLVDRYYNVIKKLRKNGLWKEPPKRKSRKIKEQNQNEIIRLQLMTCNDWNRVLKWWNDTFNYRMSINRQKSMMEICNYWSKYNHIRAIELVEIDYNLLFPGTSNNLFSNWDRYIEKWKHLLMGYKLHQPNDEFYRRLMTEQLSEDTQNYLIFMLLHNLLPPNCMINHVVSKTKIWRPCSTNSQNSVTIHVLPTRTGLSKKIEEIKTIYFRYGLDMHPFIIVTGSDVFNYSESFIYLNDHLHKTDSFLKSLDLCFKLYKIFHLEFPKQSLLVWQLIERLFYKTEHDVTEPPVIQLIHSLNKIRLT